MPVFNGFLLELFSSGKANADYFMSLAGGISFRQPLNESLVDFGSARDTSRMNGDQTEFDNNALDLNVGCNIG